MLLVFTLPLKALILLLLIMLSLVLWLVLFFFNDTATTEIYSLSLHDALPISPSSRECASRSTLPIAASMSSTKASTSLCGRSEEHTSELQSHSDLVCRLLLENKNAPLALLLLFLL